MKRSLIFLALVLFTLSAAAAENPAGHYFGGLTLVDQNGKKVELYDLMKGKTAVINSFFASCTASCVVMSKSFLYMQNKFGERVGNDVVLISITVDPEHDTPEKLHAYAKRIGARPGWYFLTGTRPQVDAVLHKLGQYTDSPATHMNVIVAGNDRTGLWKKALGIAASEDIYKVVASVADDGGSAPAGGR